MFKGNVRGFFEFRVCVNWTKNSRLFCGRQEKSVTLSLSLSFSLSLSLILSNTRPD